MRFANVAIRQNIEPWASAQLADGTVIRVKPIFIDVQRILDDDGKPAFLPDGKPHYALNIASHVDVRPMPTSMQQPTKVAEPDKDDAENNGPQLTVTGVNIADAARAE